MPVVAEYVCADGESAAGYALRFVLREMGNGVDRVEAADMVLLSDLENHSCLSGAHQVFPLPRRLEDAALEAGASLGLPRCRAGHVVEAWARSIDERTIELFLRRVT